MEVSRLLSGLCFVVLRISLAVACEGTEDLVTHESVTYVIRSLEIPCSAPLVLWSTVLVWRIASSQPHRKGNVHIPYCGTLPFKICHRLFPYLLHIAVWQCGPYSNWLRILKSFCFFGSGCQMWELMKTVFATSQHKTGCIHESLDRLVCLCLEKAEITNKCLSGSENTIM